VFTAELQQALADPGQLPGDELFDAAGYRDGRDEAFLRRLWYDLYGDQPYPGAHPGSGPAHRADPGPPGQEASPASRRGCGVLRGSGRAAVRPAHRAGRPAGPRGRAAVVPLHRGSEYGLAVEDIAGTLAQAQVPVTDQERSDMLALTATMNMDNLVPRALGFCPRAGWPRRGEGAC
jgi:hypothetical protein